MWASYVGVGFMAAWWHGRLEDALCAVLLGQGAAPLNLTIRHFHFSGEAQRTGLLTNLAVSQRHCPPAQACSSSLSSSAWLHNTIPIGCTEGETLLLWILINCDLSGVVLLWCCHVRYRTYEYLEIVCARARVCGIRLR